MRTYKVSAAVVAFIFSSVLAVSAQTDAQKAAGKSQPASKKAASSVAVPATDSASPVVSQFDKAVGNISSTDPLLRRQAADVLAVSRNEKAAPYLVKALSDTVPSVRAAAVDGLCQLNSRASMEKISDLLLNDPDEMVRQQAASSLSYMRDQASGPALVKALDDKVLAVRYAAANTLGAIKYAPAEDKLIFAMKDNDMRRIAISALGQLKSSKAASSIAAALGDSDRFTRVEALKALGDIGYSSAAQDIKSYLVASEDPSVRIEAALSLSKFGVSDGLSTAYEFAKSNDMSLKMRALDVMSRVGDARTLQYLQEAYSSEQNASSKSMIDFARQRLSARLAQPK